MGKMWFEKKVTFKEFIDPYSAMDAYQRSFEIIVENEEEPIEDLIIVWTHRYWSELYSGNTEKDIKDYLAFSDDRLPYGICLNSGDVPFEKVLQILKDNYNDPEIILLDKYEGFDYSINPYE